MTNHGQSRAMGIGFIRILFILAVSFSMASSRCEKGVVKKDNLNSVVKMVFVDNWDWLQESYPSQALRCVSLTIDDLGKVKAICDLIRVEEGWKNEWMSWFEDSYLQIFMVGGDNKVLYEISVFPDGYISIGGVDKPLGELLDFSDNHENSYCSTSWGRLGRNRKLATALVDLAKQSPAEKKKFVAIEKWWSDKNNKVPVEYYLFGFERPLRDTPIEQGSDPNP